jgi:hypothetical protein
MSEGSLSIGRQIGAPAQKRKHSAGYVADDGYQDKYLY